jgi:uncharacterized membrane protein YfcA
MAEPVTTSAGVVFSISKAWTILASVCGSVIPILALSEERKTSFKNAVFMAIVGSSFAIFVGPWVAEYLHLQTLEAIVALSWGMGAIGVYLIRAILHWLDHRGEDALDKVLGKFTGNSSPQRIDLKVSVSEEQKP